MTFEPAALVAVSVTEYVPGLYVWTGFWSVEVLFDPDDGSPKFQA